MLKESNQKDRELHKVKINSGPDHPKKLKSLEDLEVIPLLLFASFRFLSEAALALRIFLSSSVCEVISSDSYS